MLHLKLLYSLCHLLISPSHYLTSEIRASETDEYNCVHVIHLFIDCTYYQAPLWNCSMWLFNRVQKIKCFSRCGFQTMGMRLTGKFAKNEKFPDPTQTFCIRFLELMTKCQHFQQSLVDSYKYSLIICIYSEHWTIY